MISVLLPYRDAAATLGDALASVLAGEGPATPLEVLAIDDGSRDGGPAVVRAFAERDPRVVPLQVGAAGEGAGVAAALTTGLAHARGALIGRMDADDISLPGRFAAAKALLEADAGLAVVGTRVEAFPAPGAGLAAYVAWQNSLVTAPDHATGLFVESPLCHPSVLMRRSALEAVGGYRDGPFPEDYDLWLRFDAAGFAMAKADRVLFRWRHQPGRVTFTDPRCAPDRLLALRTEFLAHRLRGQEPRELVQWGAGQTGRRVARALGARGITPTRFIDIDPRKVGRRLRGQLVVTPETLFAARERPFVVVAVGARGARDIVRGRLTNAGFVEGADFLAAS